MVDKNIIMRLLKSTTTIPTMWLLKKYFTTTGTITIDDRGLVSCTGDVVLKIDMKHERLPVSFDKVDGYFWCNENKLTTLEGAPQSVGRKFWCSNNQLTSLEHCPQIVGGDFDCYNNRLTTLEHSPQSVVGGFKCYSNQLTTLEGAPKSVGGDFSCYNNQLTTLEHSPQRVGGHFSCDGNRLTTLEHAPKSVGTNFYCSKNKLTTLEGLPVVPGELMLSYSPTLPLLRCLLAQKVKFYPELRDKTVETILKQYAGQGEAGAFACGAELATAGYKENARW